MVKSVAHEVPAPGDGVVPGAPAQGCGAEDFPGCESFPLPEGELEGYEGRLEFWDGRTETAWKVSEPTSFYHEGPSMALDAPQDRVLLGAVPAEVLVAAALACTGEADFRRRVRARLEWRVGRYGTSWRSSADAATVSPMCGRFTQKMTWKEIHALYRLPEQAAPLNLELRYNGCPTQDFAVCRLGEGSTRSVAKLRWGLIPAWARDRKMAARLINARAETVHEKPAFRVAFRRRRCLVPADGWLEWRNEGGVKQPYYISAASGAPLSFAGLWERWEKGGEPLESFAIVTTSASEALSDLHPRQPVLVEAHDWEEWLAPDTGAGRLLALARHPHPGPFARRAVSRRVNNPRNDEPDLLLPLDR